MNQSRKPRVVRGPQDGNKLWHLYNELGTARRQELRTTMEQGGFGWWTFYQDTKADCQVDLLPYRRVVLYQQFFGLEDLWTAPEPAPMTVNRAA